jgi:hypothetical protein
MMVTATELEEIIARTPAGEQIVYDGREIGLRAREARRHGRSRL